MRQISPKNTSFLPDFCNARTVFVVILLAELLAIVLTLAQPPYLQNQVYDLAMYSLFLQWVALCCTGVLCISRRHLQHCSDHWAATISYAITLIVTVLIAELAWWVLGQSPGNNFIGLKHHEFLLPVTGISAIVWALALRYFYVQHQWRIRVASESEARFLALQARMKPHFLFNCMNTIASLIRRNPVLAEEVVEDLSDLFRASLQDTQHISTLEEEIALCKRYLRIEQLRLGNRLEAVWQMDELPSEVKLPSLSIQPLLENAIYHGIEPLPEGGVIHIRSERVPEAVCITIENPYRPDVTHRRNHSGNRIAQENLKQCLSSWFGRENLLQVKQENGNYIVTVTLPLNL